LASNIWSLCFHKHFLKITNNDIVLKQLKTLVFLYCTMSPMICTLLIASFIFV